MVLIYKLTLIKIGNFITVLILLKEIFIALRVYRILTTDYTDL
ncbi:hypothetical protein HNP36_002100 [Chryseobacterium shigense]|uniref:Uncharacterized protein n=1 Tax=Chryseobacterium shigense TaxID=297244 RepID=A0A841N2D2_9FLAO|nr:hypothetical protein [Chryseobacterium shigense]